MVKYVNQTFKNKVFVVEECVFENCVLTDCDVFYSGGDFEWTNVKWENTRWHFRGPALKTAQLCQIMGLMKQPQIPPTVAGSSASGMMH